MIQRAMCATVVALILLCAAPVVLAQQTQQGDENGYALPNSERFRASVELAMGYLVDDAQNARLGFEVQGRVGWAIFSLFGKLNDRLSYRIEVNPVNETAPLPACGTPTYFYPNLAQTIGPNVRCESDGDKRVDDYKFLALDPISQQGPLRQAYLVYEKGWFAARFGRFILPLGFGWQEAGSFTAKDATHIQRLNAKANFGFQTVFTKRRADGSQLATLLLTGVIGEGNRNHDYNYFYFADPSLDSNTASIAIVSGAVRPFAGVQLRGAVQRGVTGSKVEYFPNYFANKHNDFADLLSAEWRPFRFARVFGEYARYTWGPTETSALLVGADPTPIVKDGHYVGGEVSVPVAQVLRLHVNVTREELLRDDSLIKFLAAQNLYGVTMGEKERDTVLRVRADVGRYVTAGFFRMWLHNPFPQVSGIEELPGSGTAEKGAKRMGVVLLAHLP